MPRVQLKLKTAEEKSKTQPTRTEIPMMANSDAESRMQIVMKGAKEGALKAIVDKLVDSISGPIAEAILPKFQSINPGAAILLEPAVRAALQFAFVMGIAELMTFAAPMATKVMPNANSQDMQHKSQLLAVWMRKYAGEKIGEQLVEAAIQVFPLVMEHFSQINTSDVAMLLEDDTASFFNESPMTQEVSEEVCN